MARRRGGKKRTRVQDYRHEEATRKNNPPAKIAAEGTVPTIARATYEYNPHLPPVLRFDPEGKADELPELLQKARKGPLSEEEVKLLADALRKHEPWLEWTEKREQDRRGAFQVDPVALHIHERISAQAILKVAARQEVLKSLFADPELEYHEAVQFYRHDIDWTNRLILGDSLQVMSSLARREDLAGKVQMIYIDPPYGIKFSSNFQPEVGQRDVRDREQDLTREPEMVKAYRDTWHLGVHSYLSYLRDRFIVARELLADTGSIFVQIGDENLHHVKEVLDEVFGPSNFQTMVTFATTGGQSAERLGTVFDFILWYAKDTNKTKYYQVFVEKGLREGGGWAHSRAELEDGTRENMGVDSVRHRLGQGAILKPYSLDGLASQGATVVGSDPVEFEGRPYSLPNNSHWKTTHEGMERLAQSKRIEASTNSLRYVRFIADFPVQPITNVWHDTNRPGYIDVKRFVVQTTTKVIERCLLMTTDPGDLVLDPTCGSGTTAHVAEQWGRRWVSIDTSRVAVALARQRVLTATFDRHRVNGEDEDGNGNGNLRPGVDPHPGFVCKTVPHVTLRDIAQNTNLDPIFAKHEAILEEELAACNRALTKVTKQVRTELERKLLDKQRKEGKRAITDADQRRWLLPPENRERSAEARKRSTVDLDFEGWYHWEVALRHRPGLAQSPAGGHHGLPEGLAGQDGRGEHLHRS